MSFPSPAEGYLDDALDLNALIIQRPAATFFVRVSGDAMRRAHVCDGDVLVIDRSLTPRHRDLVLVELDGDFVVRRWLTTKHGAALSCDDPERTPREVHGEQVWGVVTFTIHPLRPPQPLRLG